MLAMMFARRVSAATGNRARRCFMTGATGEFTSVNHGIQIRASSAPLRRVKMRPPVTAMYPLLHARYARQRAGSVAAPCFSFFFQKSLMPFLIFFFISLFLFLLFCPPDARRLPA